VIVPIPLRLLCAAGEGHRRKLRPRAAV